MRPPDKIAMEQWELDMVRDTERWRAAVWEKLKGMERRLDHHERNCPWHAWKDSLVWGLGILYIIVGWVVVMLTRRS